MNLIDLTSTENQFILILLIVWTLPWKGLALWKSAQRKEKWWFIAMLLTNTLGVLEILYLYIFSKRNDKQKVD
ncbi:MAG: hypothetical protein COV29_03875 [Candidatus Yanofskybacteria bacterium CG10_big_fil_rev_8_21_14_0_10_36_16]|uniref:DUF5652 domain-containing protein n=1 Tax=Candidatus Yanofskybacteria bacterium CG10_big_fil_rev_8_21_14_0_10_36_16 TaxID=1975096 RepID=A0A2J0Q6T0_9BACT|nr:MAG: hypothetical protein COV29_03875 [Candidatus Yanofskybacteria bacterium CG10_big_fil_rev_8_21_14_0_10_36_16]